jgi:pimeloyl-ACP methyl ester carboxylesterase
VSSLSRVGTGENRCVFLHGTPSDSSVWHEVLARRPRAVTAVLVDLPDHGRAEDELNADSEAVESRLAECLAQEGTRLTLVGHSYGAYLAARLANRLQQQVSRLVLVSGFAALPAVMARNFSALAAAMRRGEAGVETLSGVARNAWYGESCTPADAELVARIVQATGQARLERMLDRIARLDAPHLAADAYRQPAAVVHARRDAAVPFELGEALARCGTNVDVVAVDSELHMLPLSHAELIAQHAFAPSP